MRRVLAVMVVSVTVQCGGGAPTAPSGVEEGLPPAPPTIPAPVLPAGPQTFVGAGDIAMCDANSEATARLLDGIGGTVFTLGDNAYFHGTREEFRDCYDPTWGRHRSRTRPVPGNHEYESPGAQPYFEYFGVNAGPPGLGYYSFDVGGWHAVALNSNIAIGDGSAQAAWLRADVARSQARCTIAYWHHPLFSSGSGGTAAVRDVWRILYDAGADVVLVGHDHFYERFGPQDPGGRPDPARGLRQFTVGTGGAVLYQAGPAAPNSEARRAAFGVLRLTLASGGYDWEFVAVSGPGDAGTATCH
ncbi:MAG: metallophosphoesterase [Acidobacteria bacterium]|nr:metallophosphoesterase [Acidobacteriota bacterium]